MILEGASSLWCTTSSLALHLGQFGVPVRTLLGVLEMVMLVMLALVTEVRIRCSRMGARLGLGRESHSASRPGRHAIFTVG